MRGCRRALAHDDLHEQKGPGRQVFVLIVKLITAALTARLPIPVFRNLFFGCKKMFLPGFLRIFFLCYWEEFFTGMWFWRGRRNSGFWTPSQDFCAGIPVGQEFLYFLQIPPDSCSRQKLLALASN